MLKVFKQQTNRDMIGICSFECTEQITHSPLHPSTFMHNGKKQVSSCVGCMKPKCMRFSPQELKITTSRLSDFPADMEDSVCPTNAILWERGNLTPAIVSEHCINCGICARRCPFGAIYTDGNSAIIHAGEKSVTFKCATPAAVALHQEQMQRYSHCFHMGYYQNVNVESLTTLYNKASEQQTEAQFPNLIVRNLFLVLGVRCIIRRRGDVYIRIDAIIEDSSDVGIVEVEFRKDSLESPRAILDDIAVLSARYGIEKQTIKPFIISFEFPNIRTEYWRVIKDIKDVLNIRIQSLSLGALCVLVWGGSEFSIGTADFYADVNGPSIRESVHAAGNFRNIPEIVSIAVFEPKK